MLQEPSRMKIPSLRVAAAAVSLLILQVQVSPASWQQTSAPTESWTSVASSPDGSNLVTAANGPIYTSTDSGLSWQQTSAPLTNWAAVASSADGTKLEAVVDGGLIYSSTNAGGAWTVLTAICEWLPVRAANREFGANSEDGGGSALGVYVNPPSEKRPPSERHAQIQQMLGESDGYLIWFGYMADAQDRVKKSVWFHCKDRNHQRQLLDRLKGRYLDARPKQDDAYSCVVIDSGASTSTKDFDWFKDAITAAIS